MSKIGRQPVEIPQGVEITIDGAKITVKGTKGYLTREFPRVVVMKKEGNEVLVSTTRKDKGSRAIHGTVRSLISNMVKGVSEGWSKKLELVGAGYRAQVEGNTLVLTVGFIQPVKIQAPQGVTFKVEKNTLTVDGIDKEVVGEISAKIRGVRPPEPYQGKGVRYFDEVIKKKPGKAAKAGEAA